MPSILRRKYKKEILNIYANKVRNMICEEIENAKYCILVDEALDEGNKEKIAIILRFGDGEGYVRERLFDIVEVVDTKTLILKSEICIILPRHDLQVQDMRGQGYDGASNMRAAWNGLQALFLKDCPYAYYVHCFACRLQLALVAVCKDVPEIWQLYSNFSVIDNFLSASSKCLLGKLKLHIKWLLENLIQVDGVIRLIEMFGAASTVLENIIDNAIEYMVRLEADGAYNAMISFDFVFALHLLYEVMGITDMLCQALQHKLIDILNVMSFVSSTRVLLRKLREDGWDIFLKRFCEEATELLILSSTLNSINHFKSFKVDDACTLAEKFYPQDFTIADFRDLRRQLAHFEHNVVRDETFQNMSSFSELCRRLVETRKAENFFLIDKLIRLVLTLPVSTATTERAFSVMKIVKTTLRNKMGNDFLADFMIIKIAKELARNIDLDSIIDDFYSLKDRKVQLK